MSNHSAIPTPPSEWVKKHIKIIPKRGTVLDLACGAGRHTRLLIETGRRVFALDCNISKLKDLSENDSVTIIKHDLETTNAWPFAPQTFDGIIVTNYLYRPLYPCIIDALAVGGVLIYQTFAVGNEKYGRPQNPDYLLKEDELLKVFGNQLNLVDYSHGYIKNPSPAVVQSICCIKIID